ncbi:MULTISPECIES: cation:proton antiporter domain-containing protein [Chromobacterium]|uniref:Cation:proton antiporter n=2 Tax=Chromobacterium TaxID=535 RepID=A0ABS3GL77_9NEIS|nr:MULTISPECIES: cation:proton antiporter [Chromobacterium]AXT45467.1 potassium transporter [Chromobacterium rhizoryzae]MBK0414567.1 cation:proton antiporter [Chromobacterium haemolyticum]MBO0415799.1 cation:proton antiporter [Chromobacterium haemolyticum]MBO0499059.1 cation:proton antiporter [Chromobacterium haemolyticum]MDH0341747.1 cation:proton antiporter [Chromobacterium haemolyticum]
MHSSLAPIVLVLLAAVLSVTLCRSLKVPAMLGYLVVGFLAGPGVMNLIPQGEETAFLGEIGIVFMMFSIGLEFSLPKLRAMRQLVFGVGFGQVAVTMLLVGLAVGWISGSPLTGFAVGGALAMSSTAIVSKLLNERLELNQAHGQLAIGVLLFQDIAVVPLLILFPAFAGGSDTLWMDLGLAALKVVVVLALLLFFGQRLLRPWFHLVARQRSGELFMINVLLVTLGVAWLTELSGLSLALGAFVAGMLISETEYRYQVEEDIRPFRDILLGFFFVTVGMKLELTVLFERFGEVLLMLALLLPIKVAVVFGVARGFRHKSNESMRAALALAQGGEFGFVLLALALNLHLVPAGTAQAAIAAILISMLIAPFLILYGDKITRRLIKQDWMFQALDLHHMLVESMSKNDHVVICGYGRSGQALARLLEAEDIPFFALDMDPERVREAGEAGDPVVFGDAGKHEVLVAAGLMRAKAVVVTFADTHAALRILSSVEHARPGLPVIVRTVDDSDMDQLRHAGADEVVAEVMEGSLMLASQALLVVGVPPSRVVRRIRAVREERYGLFRGFFRGVSDEGEGMDEALVPRLQSIQVCTGAAAVGQPLANLHLRDLGVELKAIRRQRVRRTDFDDSFEVEQGDALVLLGTPEQLALAEYRILQGD